MADRYTITIDGVNKAGPAFDGVRADYRTLTGDLSKQVIAPNIVSNANVTFVAVKRANDALRAEIAKPITMGSIVAAPAAGGGNSEEAILQKLYEGRRKGMEKAATAARRRNSVQDRIDDEDGVAKPGSINARAFSIADRTAIEQSRRDREAAGKRNQRSRASTTSIDRRAFDIADNRSSIDQSERNRQASDLRVQRGLSRSPGGGDDVSETRSRFSRTGSGSVSAYAKAAEGAGGSALLNAAAFVKLGEILGSIPQVVDDTRAAMKTGEDGFAAVGKAIGDNVPVIGGFVKAGMGLKSFLNDFVFFPDKRKAAESKEEQQDLRNTRDGMRDRQNAKRGEINTEAATAAQAANDSLSVTGLQGDALAKRQAAVELAAKQREAGALRQKAGSFSNTDDQDRIRGAADKIELAAKAKYAADVDQIDRKQYSDEVNAARDHKEQIAEVDAATAQTQLEEQGKLFTAKMKAIEEQNRQEIAAAAKKRDEEQKNLSDNGVSNNDPRFAATQRRFEQESSASSRRRSAAESAATTAEAFERSRRTLDGESQITQIRAKAAEAQLRLRGDQFAAEKLQRDEAFREDIEALKKRTEDQVRQHKEDEPNIRDRAKREQEARTQQYQADDKQAALDDLYKYKPKGPAPFAGESRLLTGVGSTTDPALAPAQQTAQNTKDAAGTLAQVLAGINALVAKVLGESKTPVFDAR